MQKFTLSVCKGIRQNASTVSPYTATEISSLNDFRDAVQYDISDAVFKNEYRSSKNFMTANVVGMDCDNDNNEDNEKWILPETLAEMLSGVEFVVCYSRNHMKQKKDKSPRPRFHVFFPLSEAVDTVSKFKELKELFLYIRPEFDAGAKDAARCFYGVDNPQVELHEGNICLDEYFIINGIELPKEESKEERKEAKAEEYDESIGVGERHSYLLKVAFDALSKYGESKAREIFDKACLRCKPQKPLDEIQRIWSYALEKTKEIKSRQRRVLTLSTVEETLEKLGISLEFDVIRKELRVSDLPQNSEYVHPSYYPLDAYSRKKANVKMLPTFLMTYFKDKNFGVNESFIHSAICNIADSHPYNPVRKMLENTTRDNESRLEVLYQILGISNHLSYEAHMYRVLLRKWLHQAIAVALNDKGEIGNEFVLSLQGKQGAGKTNFFRRLAVLSDLFAEGVTVDVTDKDSIMRSTNVWIAELGELDSTLKKEQAALKSFLTAHYDTYRKPYGRNVERIERRTCFAGTVNPEASIRDTTGSRRYVFIHVENLNKDFIYNKMTPEWTMKLWREVYETLYLPNPKGFYLEDNEIAFTEQNNERFTVELEGESELRDMLRWTDDTLNTEEYAENWTWQTLTALKENTQALKDEKVKSPKLGLALMKIIRSFGLNPDDFKRRVHGRTEYKLPSTRTKYDLQ